MSDRVKLYPAIHMDMLAEPFDFVMSWNRLFVCDKLFFNYIKILCQEGPYSEDDMLKMFEWLHQGKLSPADYAEYQRDIGSKIEILNHLKESVDIGCLLDLFGDIRQIWLAFLMHIIVGLPYFDEHTGRAYFYISTGKRKELANDEYFGETYHDYHMFWEELERLTPDCTIVERQNALWIFGKFLKGFQYECL